jgi:ATP-dependent RNA helicase DDX21
MLTVRVPRCLLLLFFSYGGTSISAQCQELRAGVHIVVCTPGRVLDLLERRALNLSSVTHVVLDEADRMLDMGFQDDMDKIFEAMKENPASRQVALFSATLPPWVQNVAKKYMSEDVVTVDLVEDESQKAAVTVRHIAIPCQWTSLAQTIGDVVSMFAGKKGRTIVFCETKKDCNELCVAGGINVECQALHGDISQQQRETTLTAFKQGRFGVLVATDVAARGLDMVVDLVINAKPPVRMSGRADTETYVHRSGRTGRANRSGVCVTLYTPKYRQALKDIEREVGNTFEWRGAPQPHEIIAASGRQAAEQLDTVDGQAVEVFIETARSLIETMGAEKALAAALACMTGHTQALRQRSLLSNTDGYVTIMFHANREIPTHSYVFGALRRNLPEEVVESIRGMAITADGLGAVFDTPVENLEQIKDAIKRAPFQYLSIPDAVPELKDREYTGPTGRFPNSSGGRGGRGSWGGRGGSSYGGRGGGRGGYSGGRGGRGRGRF